MKEVKKLLVVLVAAVFFIGLFVLCDKYSENVKADYASQINPSIVNQGSSGTGSKGQTVDAGQLSVEKMVQNMVTKDYSASVTLAAAGDILCQQSVLEKAYNSDSEKFDFSDDFQSSLQKLQLLLHWLASITAVLMNIMVIPRRTAIIILRRCWRII